MKPSTTRILGLSLSVLLGLAPMMQAGVAPVGTLSGDGKVRVNGKPLAPSQLAFPGDVIDAPGAAMGSIEISPNSVARFTAAARASVERSGQEVWLGLQSGYVSVHEGDKPVSVRAHGGKILGSAGSVFDVAQVNAVTVVTVVKGSATISEGGMSQPRIVTQGQNVKVSFLEPGPAAFGTGAGSFDPQQQQKKVCNDPCKASNSSKECKDFKELKKSCKTMRDACAKDSSKCDAYNKSCSSLDGCAGFVGAGAGGAGAAAAAAGATTGAASATVVGVTAAVVAGTAAAVAIPVAAAASNNNNNNIVSH